LFVDDYDGWIIRHYLGAKGAPSGSVAAPEPAVISMTAIAAALLFNTYRRLQTDNRRR
jgi:hypothetical protein